MAIGLAVNAAAQTGITTAFDKTQGIALADVADAIPMPAGGYWAHCTVICAVTSGTPVTMTAMLAWDSAGDNMEMISGASTVQAGLTTTANDMVTFSFESCYRTPAGVTPGRVYLFLKTSTGTVTVPIGGARLVWSDGPSYRQ